MDKRARQAKKVRNFGFNYDARKTMSDPKPYTMNECPVWHGTVASVHLGRVRATVEALEQERVEYAAEAQRHDETKAALLEAQRERDALRAEVERLTRERDEALGEES